MQNTFMTYINEAKRILENSELNNLFKLFLPFESLSDEHDFFQLIHWFQ